MTDFATVLSHAPVLEKLGFETLVLLSQTSTSIRDRVFDYIHSWIKRAKENGICVTLYNYSYFLENSKFYKIF